MSATRFLRNEPHASSARRLPRWVLAACGAVILASCGAAASAGGTKATVAASPTTSSTTVAATSSSGAGGSASGQNSSNRQAGQQAWRDCLTQNGVTLPSVPAGNNAGPPASNDPNANPPAGGNRGGAGIRAILQDPANAKAVAACQSLQPQFGGGNRANRAAYQAYLSCLADNGVAVPTTSSTPTAGPRTGPPATVNKSDPNFAAANAKCKVLLPATPNGGVPATSGPTTTTGA